MEEIDMPERLAIFPKIPRGRRRKMNARIHQEIHMKNPSAFVAALCADGPAPEHAEKLSLYGWLIGDWQMQTTIFRLDGTKITGRGEIHFAWALQGRAVQDVWILPEVFYGT